MTNQEAIKLSKAPFLASIQFLSSRYHDDCEPEDEFQVVMNEHDISTNARRSRGGV